MSTGLYVLIAALVAALVLGLHRVFTDGRFRGTHRVRGVEEVEHRTGTLVGAGWYAVGR